MLTCLGLLVPVGSAIAHNTFLQWQVAAVGAEKTNLDRAINTVDALLASTELWSDFDSIAKDYPEIYVGPEYNQAKIKAGHADAAGAAAFLRNTGVANQVFPAIVSLVGTNYISDFHSPGFYRGTCTRTVNGAQQSRPCFASHVAQNHLNMEAATYGLGPIPSTGTEDVAIVLGRELFRRHADPDVRKRSCTYNTLAHEWVHTIGPRQNGHSSIAQDSGAQPVKLSYLFGSVAQCSWLQTNKHIGDKDADLKACVARYGVGDFKSAQCD
jgi:hypothetical protein